MKKNNAIEFYRIIATLIICVHHIQSKCGLDIIKHGDLLVDFFFILSGLFLAVSFDREKSHSGSRFFIKRVKRFYPEYIPAAVIGIVSYSFVGKFDISKALSEIVMVQNTGPFFGGYNYPCWYLSALLFGGFIIYQCLNYNSNLFIKLAAPVVCLAGYTYISANIDTVGFIWSVNGFVYIPLLRCICGMTAGIYIYYLSKCRFAKNISKWFGSAIEIISLIVVSLGLFTTLIKVQITVSVMALLIFITYNKSGILSSKLFNANCFSKASVYTYSVYLNHGIFANIFDVAGHRIGLNGKIILVAYVAFVIIYSVIYHNIISIIMKKVTDKNNKYKNA